MRMRQQKLTCRECGLLFHRTCSCKYFLFSFHFAFRERSGSVVECLTRDREAAGSSLTGVTVVVLEQDTFILA